MSKGLTYSKPSNSVWSMRSMTVLRKGKKNYILLEALGKNYKKSTGRLASVGPARL